MKLTLMTCETYEEAPYQIIGESSRTYIFAAATPNQQSMIKIENPISYLVEQEENGVMHHKVLDSKNREFTVPAPGYFGCIMVVERNDDEKS